MNIDEINGLLQQDDNDWYLLWFHWRWEDFLWVFIQHGALSNGYMNVWEVNQGGGRCEEVISALLAFFESPEIGGSELVAWSDSWVGQNKKNHDCILATSAGFQKLDTLI